MASLEPLAGYTVNLDPFGAATPPIRSEGDKSIFPSIRTVYEHLVNSFEWGTGIRVDPVGAVEAMPEKASGWVAEVKEWLGAAWINIFIVLLALILLYLALQLSTRER